MKMAHSFINTNLIGSPTRENILILIKKHGGLSVEELSRHVGITPMGVRQHLMTLEKSGMITYDINKHGIGRPVFIYRLTDRADNLFPKAYSKFLVHMLERLEETDGRDKVRDIFKATMDKMYAGFGDVVAAKSSAEDRLLALAGLLEEEGRMVDLEKGNGHLMLKQYNCPISKVSEIYRDACKYDLDLFRKLIGRSDIERTACIADGDTSCTFMVPIA